MNKVNKIKMVFIISLLICALIIGVSDDTNEIKAPTLTLTGGITVLVALVPIRKLTVGNFGIITGTLVAIAGSYFWVSDASSSREGATFVLLLLYLVILIALFVWFLILFIGVAYKFAEAVYKFAKSFSSRRKS